MILLKEDLEGAAAEIERLEGELAFCQKAHFEKDKELADAVCELAAVKGQVEAQKAERNRIGMQVRAECAKNTFTREQVKPLVEALEANDTLFDLMEGMAWDGDFGFSSFEDEMKQNYAASTHAKQLGMIKEEAK